MGPSQSRLEVFLLLKISITFLNSNNTRFFPEFLNVYFFRKAKESGQHDKLVALRKRKHALQQRLQEEKQEIQR